MQSMFDERNWLAWLVKVRILILTFLLGIQLTVAGSRPPHCRSVSLLAPSCCGIRFPGLHVFALLLERASNSSVSASGDRSGFGEPGGLRHWRLGQFLNFLYPLVIIVAAVLLPRVWAHLVAALAFLLYGTVLELNYYGVVPSYSTTHPAIKALQAIILVNLFAFLAVAYLAGLLTSKLRQVECNSSTPAERWKICRPCTRTSSNPSAED